MLSGNSSAVRKDMSEPAHYDAVVLGAGFAGIRALYELNKLGLSIKGIEAGSDIGGAWYWNRYPGARTDSEAWAYCYSFSPDLFKEWTWAARLPSQEEVQSYLSHVADRFGLREKISFDTRITAARFDEDSNRWTLSTQDGQSFTASYFVAATGPLSAAYKPDFKGLDDFKGEWHMAANWPAEDVDFAGKRVAIIGSGSTGIQILPLVAANADHVSLFQRTPNYVLPARNYPIEKEHMTALKANHAKLAAQIQNHPFAYPLVSPNRTYEDVTDEERQRILEAGWEAGGFRFMFETFDDIFADKRTNDAVTAFIRGKIRSIVRDPKTAELLMPSYVFGAKRPPTGNAYYECFNRDNVALVDISRQPIDRITAGGIVVDGQEHPVDMIIFATGFDAATGALSRMDVRGRGGQALKDKWHAGPRTNLGIMADDFPNMFMVLGPQSPFANAPPVVENIVEWIAAAIAAVERQDRAAIEPEVGGVERWNARIQELFGMTLFGGGVEARAWFLGANIPGKEPRPLFYFGGANDYFVDLDNSKESNFSDFKIS